MGHDRNHASWCLYPNEPCDCGVSNEYRRDDEERLPMTQPNLDLDKLREVSFITLTLVKLTMEWHIGKQGGEDEQDYVIAVENQIIELLCHNKEANTIAATMLRLEAEKKDAYLKGRDDGLKAAQEIIGRQYTAPIPKEGDPDEKR